jgi:methyltransferase
LEIGRARRLQFAECVRPRLFWALCVAVGVQRIVELVWSRRNERRMARRGARRVREPAFGAMVALHSATLMAAPVESWAWARRRRRPPPPSVALPALAAFGAATALRAWTLATLGRSWSVRVLHFPDGARPVVAGGPYRWVRHPNYLAVAIELLSLPLVGGAFVTAAAATLANALLMARRIPLEERELLADSRYRALLGPRPRLVPRLDRGRRS